MAQNGFFPYSQQGYGGMIAPDVRMKVAASTDVSVGDALDINSSGYLQLANSGDAILGVAAEAVTGAAGVTPNIGVWLALPGRLFIVATETTDPAQTDIGEKCDIATETTGAYDVNPGATTNGDFLVLAIEYPNDPAESGTPAEPDGVIGVFAHTLWDYDTDT